MLGVYIPDEAFPFINRSKTSFHDNVITSDFIYCGRFNDSFYHTMIHLFICFVSEFSSLSRNYETKIYHLLENAKI